MRHPPYAIVGQTVVPEELKILCERRVRPFLDRTGVSKRSVEHLMCEAYLQGLKDAVEAMEHRKPA